MGLPLDEKIIKDFFGYNIPNKKAKLISEEKWEIYDNNNFLNDVLGHDFNEVKHLLTKENLGEEMFEIYNNIVHPNSIGKYYVDSGDVVVKNNTGYENVTVFHELFGHGWFFEKSILGKQIKNIKNYESQGKKILQNNKIIEGFALWTEKTLSDLFGFQDEFQDKLENFYNQNNLNLLNEFDDLEKKCGVLGILGQTSMPKFYNHKKVLDTLQRMYGKDIINNSELVMLYGSQKPYSDIDLFIVNDNIKSYYNNWIDVYVMPVNEFKQRLNLFDISVTDPIYTGTPIIGDEIAPKIKNMLENIPITQQAINFNYKQAKQQKSLLNQSLSERDRKVTEGYSRSYFANAVIMDTQGKKNFTKEELIR